MKKPIICIDAGHGGHDSGALGPNGVKEKDIALAVALLLSARIIPVCEVVMTRKTDVFLSLTERCRIANSANADAFISIHCNSARNPAHGSETWIYRGSAKGLALAEPIQEAVADAFRPRPNRGVKSGSFTVLTETRMPAALVEMDFIHTAEGEALLSHAGNQAHFAAAIAQGARRFLGVEDAGGTPALPEPPACPALTIIEEAKAAAEQLLKILNRAGR